MLSKNCINTNSYFYTENYMGDSTQSSIVTWDRKGDCSAVARQWFCWSLNIITFEQEFDDLNLFLFNKLNPVYMYNHFSIKNFWKACKCLYIIVEVVFCVIYVRRLYYGPRFIITHNARSLARSHSLYRVSSIHLYYFLGTRLMVGWWWSSLGTRPTREKK